MIPEITPLELKSELAGSDAPRLLDIREDYELAIAKLDQDLHIPMGQLGARMGEIDPTQNWVVICRSGSRSAHVTEYLASQGYRVRNLKGGLLRWSRDVDPTMRTY